MGMLKNVDDRHKTIYRALILIVSSLIYSISMNIFFEYGNLFPGGTAGISRLLYQLANMVNIPLTFSPVYFALNIIIAVLFAKPLGKHFTSYTVVWFTLTSIFTAVLPKIQLTDEIILITIFGGIVSGFATSLVLNINASTGGTDFIAMYFSIKKGVSTWSYIFGFNCLVLIVAGLIFGWDRALYSIVYQFVYTQVVNFMHERYKHVTLFIITQHPDDVAKEIYAYTTHSLTVFKGEGGFAKQTEYLVFTTITMDEYTPLIKHIKAVEPHAFITVNSTERIVGRFIQRPLD